MSAEPELVTVHLAIDRWSGGECVSTIVGAWSTAETFPGGQLHDVLDHVRDCLGRRWQPASVEMVNRMVELRRTERNPWEQISLF